MGSIAAPSQLVARERIRALNHAAGLQCWLKRFCLTVGLLMLGGILASFSSTVFLRIAQDRPAYSAFIHHLVFLAIGLVLAGVAVLFITKVKPSRKVLSRIITLFYFAALILVIMVKFSPFGVTWLGATRGLNLGFITFQPSELLKIAAVLYYAVLLCWWRLPKPEHAKAGEEDARTGWGWFRQMWQFRSGRPVCPELPKRCMIILLGTLFFTVIQPDLGTTGIILGASTITFILAGIDLRQLLVWLAGVLLLVVIAVALFPGHFSYATKRIETYRTSVFRPAQNEDGAAYQITQSRGALAAGGLFGRGYLKSEQKMNRLPLSTSDFIFPVMVEEFGYAGGTLIIGLFVFLGLCALKLGQHCQDPFRRTVVSALGLTMCLQALVNVGTTTGSLPLSGLTMPFFSYGGTSIVITLLACGLVYAFSRVEQEALSRDSARHHD